MAGDGGWYYVKNGETLGPVSKEALQSAISEDGGPNTLV